MCNFSNRSVTCVCPPMAAGGCSPPGDGRGLPMRGRPLRGLPFILYV
nr:MAG TPA: hypothetical protein [Caudoviricetes sp.]